MVLGLSFLPGIDLFEISLFIVEFLPYILAFNAVIFSIARPKFRPLIFCAFPLFVVVSIGVTVITSYEHAVRDGYDISKPSIREALEKYIETGEGSAEEIIESKSYPPVFGKYEVGYLVKDLMRHAFIHSDEHNADLIPVTYNKGNDWYRAFLGEAMTYTSGIFENGNESLYDAQMYKIDYVANAVGLKRGDRVLDIGCGWGPLTERFSVKYGANVLGVTISEEQIKYFNKNKKKNLPKNSKTEVLLQDANLMLENPKITEKKFDKIVALEMLEHVGIKRYQEFLQMVKGLLKDDGVFYMQVAGLKRDWRFQDFVWGLFMGEHIFPGADASVPSGWVIKQLERAGFEVQRMNNLGSHYSKTIEHWLKEWKDNKDAMVKKYGIKAWRRWEVFLQWSIACAREGWSTVNMFTTTKQNIVQPRLDAQRRLVPKW